MKRLLMIVAMNLCMVVQANSAETGDEAANNDGSHEMQPGAMMGMMTHEQMMKMQEHMQQMQELMADIRQEQNPDRHQEMMARHMEQMDEAMGMMGGSRMGMPGGGRMRDMDMEQRMELMRNQMGMMHMMMNQMMQHFAEDKESVNE